MAKPTKTKYYDDVVVVCTNGGFEYVLGLTLPQLTIDVCGRSHPFYTGKENLVDTAGRVQKFEERLKKVQSQEHKPQKSKKARKFKLTLAELNQSEDSKNTTESKQKKVKIDESQTSSSEQNSSIK